MNKILLLMISSIIFSQELDSRYHSSQEINAYLDSLNNIESISNLMKVDTIGFSTQENLPILAIKISDNADIKEDEPRVLFVGQVHAEEVLGVEIVMDLINDLLFPNPNIITHMNILKQYLDIWIIPTLNPEGLNVVHDGSDLSFRKNKRDLSPIGPYPNNIFDFDASIGNDIDGVDLNRNFGFNWAFGDTFLEPDNSDYASHYDYYKGEEPFSESESIALRDLALENDFVFSIVWHSSRSGNLSEKVFTSWKWEEVKESPDLDIMKKIADSFSGLIPTEDGTSTYLPVFSGSRNGKIHDWFYKTTGCFQYLVECGTANLQPDSLLIENTIERTKPAMIYLMDRAIGYYADASQITGVVYDNNTNQPLENAVVEILEHSGSILTPRLTNEFGRYRRILDVGTYTLKVKAYGFQNQEITVVANNSSITNQNIYLEPVRNNELSLNLIGGFEDIFTIPYAVITSEFKNDSLQLNLSSNTISLPENNYKITIEMPDGYMPWEKSFLLDGDYSFSIPVIETESLISDDPWLIDASIGPWVFSNGLLKSQSNLYYQNTDSTTFIQEIETDYFSIENRNRIVVSIDHKYETEWDHDYINLLLLDEFENIVLNKKMSGSTDNEFKTDYFTILNDSSFSSLKIKLKLLVDGSVSYSGWEIKELNLLAIDDGYLDISSQKTNSLPIIPLRISSIYPNPSNGIFQVNMDSEIGAVSKVKVFNILGQEIYSKQLKLVSGEKNILLDIRNFNGLNTGSGMFFVQIESQKKQAIQKCVIIKN